VLKYHIRENRWEVVPIDASGPRPRAGHSACVHGHAMYIFGGRDEDNERMNDTWMMNLQTNKWS
jgi:hypothetical protein